MDADFVRFRSNTLFAVMPVDDATELFGDSTVRLLPANRTIWRCGDAADHIHLVLSGAVESFAEGEPPFLHKPGDVLGEDEALHGQPHGSDARTTLVTRLLSLPASRFSAYLDDHPEVALAIISNLAGDLRGRVREISRLKLQSTTQRLARYLCGLAPEGVTCALVDLRLEKRALAAELGMDPATLSRAFAKLREFGVDARKANRVGISDLATLRRMAGDDEEDE